MKLRRYSVTLMIALCCWAQTPGGPTQRETWQTGTLMNGRFWKTLDDGEKLAFVVGYANAIDFVSYKATSTFPDYRSFNGKFWPSSLIYGEVKSALDRFYETPENGQIAVAPALQVVAARSTGTDEEAVQKLIVALRAAASK